VIREWRELSSRTDADLTQLNTKRLLSAVGPLVSFLIQIDRQTWKAFTERRKQEGRTAIGVLRLLIRRYIVHGLDELTEKDTK
jgi:hypothetical protein